MRVRCAIPFVLLLLHAPAVAQQLDVVLVGNAGVSLTAGETTLLIDLPYESGAFGYMHYDADGLVPCCDVVSVITHHHRDHIDADLFRSRDSWRIVGPPSVVDALPPGRVLAGDSVTVGPFSIVAVPTGHTDDHRSYRVRWGGRVLFFTGDTDDPAGVPDEPAIDVLFITPWLNCALFESGRRTPTARSVLYHLRTDGSDRVCGTAEVLSQGARFTLSRTNERTGVDR